MKCPQCQTEMTEGDADLHGNWLTELIGRWRYVGALQFHEKGAHRAQESAVFNSDQRIKAWRCPACAGIFIEQPPWVPGYR